LYSSGDALRRQESCTMTGFANLAQLDLIINAGGESRRMGRSKALLPVPPAGTPLIAHVARRLAVLPLGRVIVVANDPDLPAQAHLPAATIFVPDAYPDTGTLGGIATGLQQVAGWAIVVACDLPLVSAPLFARLAQLTAEQEGSEDRWDAVVPVVGGYEEPLHALYHRRCLPAIETQLAQGQRRVISFLGDVRTCYVSEADLRAVDPQLHSFVNANTPGEWDAALQVLMSEPPIAQKR
jgi:molybdopterin-guanine dinucleotide biosynthesis protein A